MSSMSCAADSLFSGGLGFRSNLSLRLALFGRLPHCVRATRSRARSRSTTTIFFFGCFGVKYADSVYICDVNFNNHLIKSIMKEFFKKNWAKMVAFVCGVVLACLGKLDVAQLVSLLA